ncbi:unnamed protein product [Calypogeia fissa]
MKVLQILTLLLFIFLAIGKASSDVNPPNGYVVEGRVKVEGMGSRDFKSKTSDVKVSLDGGQQVTSTRRDGEDVFYAKRDPFSAMAGRFVAVAFLILPRLKDWNDAEM